ncbi:MAG: hypothetical protein K2Y22_02145 [Candidatus Obscuribacterales bacterium]|nr:hypothetical protein [Candidatus Obscuribacterales bacterium]
MAKNKYLRSNKKLVCADIYEIRQLPGTSSASLRHAHSSNQYELNEQKFGEWISSPNRADLCVS